MNPQPWWAKLGRLSLILLATLYCLFPIYFMLVQSLKTAQEDVFGNPLIVLHPTLENFEDLFERQGSGRGFVGSVLHRSYPFLDWLGNTLFVFAGTVKLVFQPSEERPPGGAIRMIEEGVMDDPAVDAAFGLHVTPQLETGQLGYRAGAANAASDRFLIRIIGKGGHAARPNATVEGLWVVQLA